MICRTRLRALSRRLRGRDRRRRKGKERNGRKRTKGQRSAQSHEIRSVTEHCLGACTLCIVTLVDPVATPNDHPANRVRRAVGTERLTVLARLLGRDRDQAARFETFAAQERLTLEHLWGCFDDRGRVEAAALLSPYPGRTAILTLSTIGKAPEEPAAIETVRAALEEAPMLNLAIVQALLDPRFVSEISVMRRAGFRPLATLASMERPLVRSFRSTTTIASAGRLPAGVAMEGFDDAPESQRALADLLEQTYIDTLDCPGLAGLRSTRDVLDGHRRGGRFDPALWTLLRIDGALAGALLLNETPHLQTMELVYLGLVPSARGRGLGRLLIDRAIAIAAERRVRSMMLAMDEENMPAQRLYRAAGFRRLARRSALVCPIAPR